MTNMEIPLGRRQGVNPRRLVEFIVANTSLKPKQVGDIEIHSASCIVEIPMTAVDEIDALFDRNVMRKWKSGSSNRPAGRENSHSSARFGGRGENHARGRENSRGRRNGDGAKGPRHGEWK